MTAAEALLRARSAGVVLRVEGDQLALHARERPPADVIDLIARNKPEIIALLRAGWLPEDWQAFYNERAGIAEFDGGLRRSEAEARAQECCVVEWMNRNLEPSQPGICLACRGARHANDPVLPYGTEASGHVWLHARCWSDWRAAQRSMAISALRAMGVKSPKSFANMGGA